MQDPGYIGCKAPGCGGKWSDQAEARPKWALALLVQAENEVPMYSTHSGTNLNIIDTIFIDSQICLNSPNIIAVFRSSAVVRLVAHS